MRGIGIDIVETARIASRCEKKAFLDLVFTPQEQEYCLARGNSAECLAARFAAKEAYMKAVGLGWSENAEFLEIEIVSTESGKPEIRLHGKSKAHYEANDYSRILLTMSHTSLTAVAVVLIE
jgi:holo-[acyl-carrier protein] synthase